jgi:serine/threonine protein kinase
VFVTRYSRPQTYKKQSVSLDDKARRIMNEIQLLRLVNHPFILPVLSTFQARWQFFLITVP